MEKKSGVAMQTEKREIAAFNRVRHRGIGEVRVKQGDVEGLEIEAQDHIRPRLKTEAADGTLVISYRHDWWDWLDWFGRLFTGFQPIRYNVAMREIAGLHLAGVGKIVASRIKAENLEIVLSGAGNIEIPSIEARAITLTLSGAGNIHIDALTAESLHVSLKGAGNVEIAGRVAALEVALSGAGNFHGTGLESGNARVRLSGMGNAQIWARENLDASISGLGNVLYYGRPYIARKITGLGRLESQGDR
jgi:hypothetical protein